MSTSGGSSGGGGSGTVMSVAAADTSVVIGGTPTVTPTVATGTLDVIATQHPPAANWSNNAQKITNVANGSNAQDAAAFGQIPTVFAPGTNVESYISSNVALTSNVTCYNITSVALTAGTWLVIGRIIVFAVSSGTVDVILGPNSASATGAYAAADAGIPATADYATATVCKCIVLAASASVYLNAQASISSVTVEHLSYVDSVPNASGLTAVRIA